MTVLVILSSSSVTSCLEELLKLFLLYGNVFIIADAAAELDAVENGFRIKRETLLIIIFYIGHVILWNADCIRGADGNAVPAEEAVFLWRRFTV